MVLALVAPFVAVVPFVAVADELPRADVDCAGQAALVMQAVTARRDGDGMRKTRRMLRQELDRTAGDMLAEWIFSLPEDQLTEAVGEMWQAQCEAL